MRRQAKSHTIETTTIATLFTMHLMQRIYGCSCSSSIIPNINCILGFFVSSVATTAALGFFHENHRSSLVLTFIHSETHIDFVLINFYHIEILFKTRGIQKHAIYHCVSYKCRQLDMCKQSPRSLKSWQLFRQGTRRFRFPRLIR